MQWFDFICVLAVPFVVVGAMNVIVSENGALHEKKGREVRQGRKGNTK